MVDASAVARVLGIETSFKDRRAGNVLFLPQRIVVLAQGASSASYSTTKFQSSSAPEIGSIGGFGSPANLIARQLFPANGDGVGTIPVTWLLLEDDPAGVAATGDITPSGTASKSATYRVRIGGILSTQFTIPAGAIDVNEVLGRIGDAISAVLEMPVTVAYTYGTVTSATDAGNSGDGTVTALSVTGTPRPGAYRLVCNSAVTNGGVFTLTDPLGSVISSTVTMTPGPGGTTVINEGGIQFTLTDGSADFAVGDGFTITVAATKLDTTSKWKGETANDIQMEVIGESVGVTFALTQHSGGSGNPSITAALAQIGDVWETMLLNALNISDTTTLDELTTFGEGRWDNLVRKPLVVFTGNTDATVADATAVSSARTTDRIHAQLVAPGSDELPFVVAARQLARIAPVANNNPPTDYGSQRVTGIKPGIDGEQWNYAQRDQAVKAGSSTIEVRDGVIHISDVVTMYAPAGEVPPAYRYVVDIVKLQNIIFNINLLFANPEWDGAPLVPDDQPVVNENARKPKAAKALVSSMLDNLGLQAIISDPATSKKNTTAVIDSQNPKRLNMTVPVQLSGNTNIVAIDLEFGFFFGQAQAA